METSTTAPKGKPSDPPNPIAPAKRAGRHGKRKRPMFDTLQVTRELRESGFVEPQAEAIVAAFGAIAGNVATKDDLRDFAIKDDLRNFATKDDLRDFATKDDLRNFATKDDLRDFATKDDLGNFATKDDLKAIEERMVTKDDLKHYATEASLQKAIGELRQEMHTGFQKVHTDFHELHRFFIQTAMGTVTVNIAMVTAIFLIAKYLI